jgi:hypothetical protein
MSETYGLTCRDCRKFLTTIGERESGLPYPFYADSFFAQILAKTAATPHGKMPPSAFLADHRGHPLVFRTTKALAADGFRESGQ